MERTPRDRRLRQIRKPFTIGKQAKMKVYFSSNGHGNKVEKIHKISEVISMRSINWLKERKESKCTQLSLGVLQSKDAIYKNTEEKKNLGYQEIHNLNFPELYWSKVTLMIKTQFSLALHWALTPESSPHSHLHQEVWSASPLPHWMWLLLLGLIHTAGAATTHWHPHVPQMWSSEDWKEYIFPLCIIPSKRIPR